MNILYNIQALVFPLAAFSKAKGQAVTVYAGDSRIKDELKDEELVLLPRVYLERNSLDALWEKIHSIIHQASKHQNNLAVVCFDGPMIVAGTYGTNIAIGVFDDPGDGLTENKAKTRFLELFNEYKSVIK